VGASTEPYPEAHFATFPEKLVEPCILAGTSERGACPICRAPWARVVERDWSNVPTRLEPKRAPVDLLAMAAYLRDRRQALGLSRKAVDDALGTVTLYSWFEGRPAGTEPPTPEQWTKLKDILDLDERFDAQIYGTVDVVVTDHTPQKAWQVRTYGQRWETINRTTGWAPSCACPPAEPVPCRVLDPFAGSGTTVAVAERLGRVGIGVELKAAYLRLAWARTRQAGLL
jgi:DNA methylase/Helix-turn-helix domain